MKKNELVFGQKVVCKETGLTVTVSDLTLEGNMVGITTGCIAKIVNADVLRVLPEISPTHNVQQEVPVVQETSSTIPTIKKRYSEETNSLFLLINDKVTICISNVSPEIINAVGISSCNDTDVYNKEIGDALAFSRAFAASNKVDEKRDFESFMQFLMQEDEEEEMKAMKKAAKSR